MNKEAQMENDKLNEQIKKVSNDLFEKQTELFNEWETNTITQLKIGLSNINEDYRGNGSKYSLLETIINNDYEIKITTGLHCVLFNLRYDFLIVLTLKEIEDYLKNKIEESIKLSIVKK